MQNEIWGAALITLLLASPALAQQALHCDGLDPAKPGHATRAYECVSKLSNDLEAALARLEALEADTHPKPEIPRIPKDAVVTFDDTSCPAGWSPFAEAHSRMIVGADDGRDAGLYASDPDGNQLEGYKYRGHGGWQMVTMTKAQMPKHSHGHQDSFWDTDTQPPPKASLAGGKWGYEISTADKSTLSAGRGEPHNNMPPYIALYFCKKD